MPVVNVNLLMDEKTYAGVQTGVFEVCGMVKNVSNKRVVRHLPTVVDATKEGVLKAIDFIRLHKKGALVFSGIFVVGGAIAGAVGHFATRNKRKREKQFAKRLQIYLDAARDGKLTIEILDALIDSLNVIVNDDSSKTVNLKISAHQFSELIYSIFDYTIRLAEANNINPSLVNKPKILKKKDCSDLQYYLNLQKTIFEQAA